MTKPKPCSDNCRRCCGPRRGPSRDAALVQIEQLMSEVANLRHFLRGGDARLSMHLWVIWRADAWRHSTRAEAFAAQLRKAGQVPKEPTIPPLPAPHEADDQTAARWFAQAATTEGDAAA